MREEQHAVDCAPVGMPCDCGAARAQRLREKMVRELRAGFLERDRALALLAASNVADTVEALVAAEVEAALPACPDVGCEVRLTHVHSYVDGEGRVSAVVRARPSVDGEAAAGLAR